MQTAVTLKPDQQVNIRTFRQLAEAHLGPCGPFESGRQKSAVEQKLHNLAGVAAVRREPGIGDARQGRRRAGAEERLMALGYEEPRKRSKLI